MPPLSASRPARPASWRRLLGELRRAVPCAFVSGGRGWVPRGHVCGFHSHRTLEIVYHPRGTGVTGLGGGQALSFSDGDTVIYAPGQLHDQRISDEGEDVCIQLEIPSSCPPPRGALRVAPLESPILAMEMESLALPHLKPGRGSCRSLSFRASAVLAALLEAAFQEPAAPLPPAEAHLLRAEAFLLRHFHAIGSLQEVAAHAGLSADYLRHLFRQRRGKTMVRFLNELRVDRAKSLLAHSHIGIKEIARQCGFRDVYYFSAVFTRHVRLSPGRYRLGAWAKDVPA